MGLSETVKERLRAEIQGARDRRPTSRRHPVSAGRPPDAGQTIHVQAMAREARTVDRHVAWRVVHEGARVVLDAATDSPIDQQLALAARDWLNECLTRFLPVGEGG